MNHAPVILRALPVLVGAMLVLIIALLSVDERPPLTYEAQYTDSSSSGMKIVPASCASYGPSYFHNSLTATEDGLGYIAYPDAGYSDYGVFAPYAGEYVCIISNASANTYFIPAYTAAELNNFKLYPPPGVTVN